MEEVNVKIYKEDSDWFGVDQADGTILVTSSGRGVTMILVKKLIKDRGHKCKINFYDNDSVLIKSQTIKTTNRKYLLAEKVKKVKKTSKYLNDLPKVKTRGRKNKKNINGNK